MAKVKYFEVDQAGIDDLKNRCFNRAREFSYFRKGEWTGVEDSISNAETWAAAHATFVMSAVAAGAAAVRLLKDAAVIVGAGRAVLERVKDAYITARPKPRHVCRRVICSSRVRKAHIKEWERLCGRGGVVTIPRSDVGPFAYVVSDRMWAIFSRFGADDLRGIEGTDQHMISMLRNRFDQEFYRLALEREAKRATRRRRSS